MALIGEISAGAAVTLALLQLAARRRATILERRLRAAGVPPDLPHRTHSCWASLGGVRLHYQEAGQGSPVVLLHGFGAATISWSFIFRALTQDHRVIAVDLKGFGLSSAQRDGRYSLGDHAALVAELLDSLDVDSAVVCGNSLGGSVALKLALDRPDLVSKLILIAAAVDADSRVRRLQRLFRVRGFGEFVASLLLVRSWFVRQQMMRIYHVREQTVTAERVRLYHRALATAGTQYAALSTLRQWDVSELNGRLSRMAQPALVLWGKNDSVVPVRAAFALASNLPRAELEILDACGHSPEEERPGDVLCLMQRFIGSQRLASDKTRVLE